MMPRTALWQRSSPDARWRKTYLALVHGKVRDEQGRITTPIARDPVRRIRMTAKLATGRSALTEYRVLQRFEKFTYLEVRIGTGRTHQIRVHLASMGHPVAGDRLYGAPASRANVSSRLADRVHQPRYRSAGDGRSALAHRNSRIGWRVYNYSVHMRYSLAYPVVASRSPFGRASAAASAEPAKQVPADDDPPPVSRSTLPA